MESKARDGDLKLDPESGPDEFDDEEDNEDESIDEGSSSEEDEE